MLASLPMYERPETRDAHDRFWLLLRQRMVEHGVRAPLALTRPSEDLLSHWRQPDLLFSQTCGHPFRTCLRDQLRLIGTPDYRVDGCPSGYYRSILICRKEDGRQSLSDFNGARLAYNDSLSQSGYVAVLHQARVSGIRLDPALETGSHRLSLHAVRTGSSDIAAIDAVTWSILESWEDGVDEVRPIGMTDPSPGLPYVTAQHAWDSMLFDAAVDAIEGLSDRDRRVLRLHGLVRITEEEYQQVPAARNLD